MKKRSVLILFAISIGITMSAIPLSVLLHDTEYHTVRDVQNYNYEGRRLYINNTVYDDVTYLQYDNGDLLFTTEHATPKYVAVIYGLFISGIFIMASSLWGLRRT